MAEYDKSDFDTIILYGKKLSHKEQAKRAMRTGKTPVETLKKFGGGGNKNISNQNMKKLDEDVGLAILGVENQYMLEYKQIAIKNNLNDRVKFLDKVDPSYIDRTNALKPL